MTTGYKILYVNYDITNYVGNFILEKEQGKLLDKLSLTISRNIDGMLGFTGFNPDTEITLQYNSIGIFRGRVKTYDKKNFYEVEVFSSAEILSRTTANKIYTNLSPEAIFSDIMTTYTDLTPVISSSGTIMNLFVAHDYIDQIITKLSQTLDWEVFTDSSKNIYFQPRGNTVNGTTIYRNATNGNANFDKWKKNYNELFNRIELTGASLSYSYTDTFVGDGTTKDFIVSNPNPENIKITINGIEQSTSSYSVTKTLNQIYFNTAPILNDIIIITYTYINTIYVEKNNTSSISSYGTFTKKITNPWLETRSDAFSYANTFITTYKDPQVANTLLMTNNYITTFNIGEQVHIIDSVESYDSYYVINKIKVEYTKGYVELNIGSYIPNFTNIQGIMKSRILDLEKQFSTISPQQYTYNIETAICNDALYTDDFTGFTEIDPGSIVTITPTKIDVVNETNGATYVYKEISAISDFSYNFEYYRATGVSHYSAQYPIILGDGYGTMNGTVWGTKNGIGIFADSNPHSFMISKWVAGTKTSGTAISYSENTLYYITLARVGTTLTLSVYSDAARTVHITGSPKTLTVVSTAFNYLNCAITDIGYSYQRSYYIQNLTGNIFILKNVTTGQIAKCNFGRGTLYDARVGLCAGS